MRITCPSCQASYNIDDRRLPAAGLNVRCPKCQNAFPVKPPPPVPAAAVPLPVAAAAPAAASPPEPPPAAGATAVPDGLGGETMRFAAPFPAASPGAAAPPPDPARGLTASFGRPAGAESPAPAPPLATVPLPAPRAVPGSVPAPLAFGEVDLPGDGGEPLPVPADIPVPADPFGAEPLPVPAPPDPFGAVPPPAAPAPRGSSGAVPPRPPPAPPPSAAPAAHAQEELEALFEEAGPAARPPPPAPRAPGPAEWSVRRRSGKIFGPFPEGEIVQMLSRGELLGNEEVTRDGVAWTAIGEVGAFGEAIRRLLERPVDLPPERPAGPSLAAAEAPAAPRGPGLGARLRERLGTLPRWSRWLLPGAAAALVLGGGLAVGLTDYGIFFHRLIAGQVGPHRPGARLCDLARARAAEDTTAGAEAALGLARQAVALSAVDREAKGIFAQVAGWMARRTGVAPQDLDQARAWSAEIAQKSPEAGDTLKAALSLALAAGGPPPAGAKQAVERWLARAPRDEDAVYLLGEAALAAGDPARAAALFQRLEQQHPTARSAHARGLAAAAQGDVAAARARFEEALARDPHHLSSELELAVLAAATDPDDAERRAARALGEKGALGPRERARARQLRGELLARRPGADAAARIAEAEKELEAAVKEDGSWLPARVAWARFLLRRNAPDRALAALQPALAGGDAEVVDLQARALAATGRVLDALNALDAAAARGASPRLTFARGWVLELGGKRAEAEKLYAEAARDPNYWEPHLALGRLELRDGQLEAASKEIRLAVEKAPAEPDAQAGLGELRFARGDLAGAAEAWRKALALDPFHASSRLGLGRVAMARGDAAAAAAELEQATTDDPRLAEAWMMLGTLRWRGGDLPGAAKALEAAAGADPRNAVARTRLGAVQLEQGQVDAAVASLTAASNVEVALAENRYWLGRALLAKGDAEQAGEELARAVQLDPSSAPSRLWLGAALERAGKLAEAADAYRAALDRDPKLVEAAERLALLYAKLDRYGDAAPLLEKAVQLAPREPRLRMELADCRMKLGQASQAIQIYQEALRADPRLTVLYYRIARAVHDSQGESAAVPWYERAAKEDRENPMPHYYLGFYNKVHGRRLRAVEEFRAYLRLKPDAEDRKDIEREIEDLGG